MSKLSKKANKEKRKAGRPARSDAVRDENGKISMKQYRTPEYLASKAELKAQRALQIENDARDIVLWRRQFEVVHLMQLDPKMATYMGKLALNKKRHISEFEWVAGVRYGKILAKYNSLVIGKSPDAPAQDVTGSRGVALHSKERIEELEAEIKNTTNQMMNCIGILGSVSAVSHRFSYRDSSGRIRLAGEFMGVVGNEVVSATNKLVRGVDLSNDPRETNLAIAGLKALALYWKLNEVPTRVIKAWDAKNPDSVKTESASPGVRYRDERLQKRSDRIMEAQNKTSFEKAVD